MKEYKHIFFDLDRTLWDFDKNSMETLEELFHEFQLGSYADLNPQAFISRYKEINHTLWLMYRKGNIDKNELRVSRFQRTLSHFGIDKSGLALDFGNRYVSRCPHKTNLLPFAKDVLKYLTEKKYKLHIISNGFEEAQYVKLDKAELRSFFNKVILSEHVGENKPSKKVFNHALREVGAVDSEVIMIGDDLEADIIGARASGLDQVYYNPSGKSYEEEVTYEVNCLSELKKII